MKGLKEQSIDNYIFKARSGRQSQPRKQAVFQGRVQSKKKQKQVERAAKLEKRLLHQKGFLDAPEEHMEDAALVTFQKQKVVVDIPEEVLLAAASGPGTTLGQPR
ncbi:hypothetical protein BJV82DRAFT_669224 [Fennellomyces sp. T-0311]|nr:hypothetical protein BJV82DRAFT_669224 [Fennellomyces sp. T-0311]